MYVPSTMLSHLGYATTVALAVVYPILNIIKGWRILIEQHNPITRLTRLTITFRTTQYHMPTFL